MVAGFQRSPKGLYVPNPVGLPGFQRQGMNQAKKGASTWVDFINTANSGATGAGSMAVTKPSGIQVSDLVLVHVEDTVTAVTMNTSGGSSWPKIFMTASGLNQDGDALFWKVLTATDVANAWDVSVGGQGALSARYRGNGATAVTSKSTNNGGGSPMTLTGFAKAANHYGVLSFVAGSSAFTPPTGFDERYDAAPVSSRIGLADRRAGYVDNAAVAWTVVSGSARGFLVEVTGP